MLTFFSSSDIVFQLWAASLKRICEATTVEPLQSSHSVSRSVRCPHFRGQKYTNMVMGTEKCVLFIEVSSFPGSRLEVFHSVFNYRHIEYKMMFMYIHNTLLLVLTATSSFFTPASWSLIYRLYADNFRGYIRSRNNVHHSFVTVLGSSLE